MDLFGKLDKLINVGKAPSELQQQINVLEVSNIWLSIEARYLVLEETRIFFNDVKDADLKIILEMGISRLEKQIKILEDVMVRYGIPSSRRPPAVLNDMAKSQVITDEYVFSRVIYGIRGFLNIHMESFIETPSVILRAMFKNFLIEEVDLYNKIFEYGKIKGWVPEPPMYRM